VLILWYLLILVGLVWVLIVFALLIGIVSYAAQFVKHFGKYGEIIDSVIMKDRKTGQPRGFGFVTYADPSVVDQVIEETHIINGKQVRFCVQ
jgi:hypothetical protein